MACAVSQIEVQNTSSSSSVSATRPPRFTMEGVGARVIRGPDWKWGKQVSAEFEALRRFSGECNKPFMISISGSIDYILRA